MEYNNGQIYQLLNHINDDTYVGSSTQPLYKRLFQHQHESRRRDCRIHKIMREIGDDKFYIELIETFPCNTREELRAREGHYIRERGTFNGKIEGTTCK